MSESMFACSSANWSTVECNIGECRPCVCILSLLICVDGSQEEDKIIQREMEVLKGSMPAPNVNWVRTPLPLARPLPTPLDLAGAR